MKKFGKEKLNDGTIIIPATQREDGSWRKEKKVKPGFVPLEEQEKYKGIAQIRKESRKRAPNNPIPGLILKDVVKSSNQPLTKCQIKKKEKLKEKNEMESLNQLEEEIKKIDLNSEDKKNVLKETRVGKVRLQKWYQFYSYQEKKRWIRDMTTTLLNQKPKTSNFLEFKNHKIVHKRYASLYICVSIENEDNELITLDLIHSYVELLDHYFKNVCELDIIYNFHKAFWILDELVIGGELQESSKNNIINNILLEEDWLIEEDCKDFENKDLIENYTKK